MKGWTIKKVVSPSFGYYFVDSMEYNQYKTNNKSCDFPFEQFCKEFLKEDSLFYSSKEYENLIAYYKTMYSAFNVDYISVGDEISKCKNQLEINYSKSLPELQNQLGFYFILDQSFGSKNYLTNLFSLPIYINDESLKRIKFRKKILSNLLVDSNTECDKIKVGDKYFEIFTDIAVYEKLLRNHSFKKSPIETYYLSFHDHFIINYFLQNFQSGKFLVRMKN